jgi:hypothetical protein
MPAVKRIQPGILPAGQVPSGPRSTDGAGDGVTRRGRSCHGARILEIDRTLLEGRAPRQTPIAT